MGLEAIGGWLHENRGLTCFSLVLRRWNPNPMNKLVGLMREMIREKEVICLSMPPHRSLNSTPNCAREGMWI